MTPLHPAFAGWAATVACLSGAALWGPASAAIADVSPASCQSATICQSSSPAGAGSVTPVPVSPPAPLTMTPASGPPGQQVTLESNLDRGELWCPPRVLFDGTALPVQVIGDQSGQFSINVPSRAPGTYEIDLQCQDGGSNTFEQGSFTVTPTPPSPPTPPASSSTAVTSVSPVAVGKSATGGRGFIKVSVVTVPSLVGMIPARARASLRPDGLGLAAGSGGDGPIAGQNPAAGTRVPRGSTVAVTLTRAAPPPRLATVPSLVGLPVARAAADVRNAGLVLGPVRSATGRISDQRPVAGTLLLPGSTVTVRLAAGTGAAPAWSLTAAQTTAGIALVAFLALLATAVGAVRARSRPSRARSRPSRGWPRPRVRVIPAGSPRLVHVEVRRADHSPPARAIRLEPRIGGTTVTVQEVHHG